MLQCGYFAETCEGMLLLNNDEIRPEVACATPLGGKADTRCKHENQKHTRGFAVNISRQVTIYQ